MTRSSSDVHIFYKFAVYFSILITLSLISFSYAAAQTKIRYTIDKEKDTYIGYEGYFQFWLRHTSLNPGSTVNEKPVNELWDISIRRYRMQLYGKLSAKTKFNFCLGNNNLNYNELNNSTPRLLDASVDYEVNPYFAIGGGKSGWTGLSRYAAPGVSGLLSYDVTFSATPLLNIADDLTRKLGIYVRGQYKRIDYRFVIAKPYTPQNRKSELTKAATFTNVVSAYQTSFYLKYQFRDKETQHSPFSTGTYLGEKEILNIGGGILYQPSATASLHNMDTLYHAAKVLSLDLFYETKLNNKNVITCYLAYFNNDFGNDFIRCLGVNNPANGTSNTHYFNGPGNSLPVTGTGNMYSAQIGYLKNVQVADKVIRLQTFGGIEYGILSRLDDPLLIYEGGINYFIKGHTSKWTLGFQSRPLFRMVDNMLQEEKRKPMFVLQYQIKFG